jgi:hypothetical protein
MPGADLSMRVKDKKTINTTDFAKGALRAPHLLQGCFSVLAALLENFDNARLGGVDRLVSRSSGVRHLPPSALFVKPVVLLWTVQFHAVPIGSPSRIMAVCLSSILKIKRRAGRVPRFGATSSLQTKTSVPFRLHSKSLSTPTLNAKASCIALIP